MSRRATAVLLIRAGWGAALVAAPRLVLGSVGAGGGDDEVVATRVAGFRHLSECLAQGVIGGSVRAWERRVDSLHALSMVAIAVRSPRHRRAALVSGAVALALLVATPAGA